MNCMKTRIRAIVSLYLSIIYLQSWMAKYCAEKQTNPYGWLSKHQTGETKVDGLFVVMMAAYLRRPIQILSHTDPWSSDANIDGAVTLIFAGDNDFTAVEVGTASRSIYIFIELLQYGQRHCNWKLCKIVSCGQQNVII